MAMAFKNAFYYRYGTKLFMATSHPQASSNVYLVFKRIASISFQNFSYIILTNTGDWDSAP
jgi:hypothetical protein